MIQQMYIKIHNEQVGIYQVICKVNHCLSIAIVKKNIFNDVTSKSYEQRLITKEHITTHLLLQYFSDKLFESSIKCFKPLL